MDTQILCQDTGDDTLPKSLAGLVGKYNLHPGRISRKAKKPVQDFDGQHCAENGAIATLESLLSIITNPFFGKDDSLGV